jgi:hypothetical protein
MAVINNFNGERGPVVLQPPGLVDPVRLKKDPEVILSMR